MPRKGIFKTCKWAGRWSLLLQHMLPSVPCRFWCFFVTVAVQLASMQVAKELGGGGP